MGGGLVTCRAWQTWSVEPDSLSLSHSNTHTNTHILVCMRGLATCQASRTRSVAPTRCWRPLSLSHTNKHSLSFAGVGLATCRAWRTWNVAPDSLCLYFSLSLSRSHAHTRTHTHTLVCGGEERGSQPAKLGEHGALHQRDIGALVRTSRHERELVQERLSTPSRKKVTSSGGSKISSGVSNSLCHSRPILIMSCDSVPERCARLGSSKTAHH